MDCNNAVTICEISAILPEKKGKKVHYTTVIRWITRGCRGVKLDAWKCGHTWFTTREKLEEFQRRLTEKASRTVCERTPRERERGRQWALEQLRKEGVI